MKSSAYPLPFYRQLPIWKITSPIFRRKSLSPSLWFFKNLTPSINKVGVYALWRLMVQTICSATSTQKSSTNWQSFWNERLSWHIMLQTCGKKCVIGNPPQLNPSGIWLGEKWRRKVTETYHACTWQDSANNTMQMCFNPV